MPGDMQQRFGDFVMPVVDFPEQLASNRPARPSSLKGKRVAVLPNFRAISPAFLQVVADRLAKNTPVAHAFVHNVPDWPFNHPDRVATIGPQIDKVARECDLMISGVSD